MTKNYSVNPGMRVLLKDLGINPTVLLSNAGLPEDLFTRDSIHLSPEEYFKLWDSMEMFWGDPLFPLKIGSAISIEAFDPAIFAALCSKNLNIALSRISKYKKLICPMELDVEVDRDSTKLEMIWLDDVPDRPLSLLLMELVFFVTFSRLATRHEIKPLKVFSPKIPKESFEYTKYFGTPIQKGNRPVIVFSEEDARRPFLTSNEKMWNFFEPELRMRLSELDNSATLPEKVKGLLLEMIPAGETSIDVVSAKLGMSNRTLQRHLKDNGTSYNKILNKVREDLAKNYLKSNLSGTEISFLLGFENPNSFYRAFKTWTGISPEKLRLQLATT